MFWASGFWATGFWADGFWEGMTSTTDPDATGTVAGLTGVTYIREIT